MKILSQDWEWGGREQQEVGFKFESLYMCLAFSHHRWVGVCVPASPAGGGTKHRQEPGLDPNLPQVFKPSGQSVTLYTRATGRAVVLVELILEAGDACASEDAVDSLHHPCFLPLKVLGPSPGPRRVRSLAFILVLVGLESGLRMQMEAACRPGRYEPGSPWASLFPEPQICVSDGSVELV